MARRRGGTTRRRRTKMRRKVGTPLANQAKRPRQRRHHHRTRGLPFSRWSISTLHRRLRNSPWS